MVRVVTILSGHCGRVCRCSRCGKVSSLGPHYPHLQQATHKLAQTTRYENAQKISTFGTALEFRISSGRCASPSTHTSVSPAASFSAQRGLYRGSLRSLPPQEASKLASGQSNTNKEFLRSGFFASTSEHSNMKCLSGTNEFAHTFKGEFYTFKDTAYITKDYSQKAPTFFFSFFILNLWISNLNFDK